MTSVPTSPLSTATAFSEKSPTAKRSSFPRVDAIDILRGLVIVVMALDHVKGNIAMPLDFVDLTRTTPAHFFTRWITHFCAPVFVFLAGTAAFFMAAGAKQKVNWPGFC